MRKQALEKELEDEPDIALTPEVRDPSPRKPSLSQTQYLQSRATVPLGRSRSSRQQAMENPSVCSSPIQVAKAKGSEACGNFPVESVACEVSPGGNMTQQDVQGHPQGSSSVSPPSPSFNLLPTERSQALHCSLAADLIQAGSRKPPPIPQDDDTQRPGTAVPMTPITANRRNNSHLSLQDPVDNRTEGELREELRQFGEACSATRSELLQSETQSPQAAQPCIELARE
jgi:hypothetical protein